MNGEPPLGALLAGFLRRRRACGDDGKTFLIGLAGRRPVFAVAAGLRGPADHPHLLRFARYLLHRRFHCDGFALMLPAERDGEPVYAVEWRAQGRHMLEWLRADGARRTLTPATIGDTLVGDLSLPGDPLPGIMRRELDALYEVLKVPPGVLSQGTSAPSA